VTANPKALDVAVAMLNSVTPSLRANIVDKGVEMKEKLAALCHEFPGRCNHAWCCIAFASKHSHFFPSFLLDLSFPSLPFSGVATEVIGTGLLVALLASVNHHLPCLF
jgi:hypothetical protein